MESHFQPFFVELARTPCVHDAFLQVLWFPPTCKINMLFICVPGFHSVSAGMGFSRPPQHRSEAIMWSKKMENWMEADEILI